MSKKIIFLLLYAVAFLFTAAQSKKAATAYSIQASLGNWDSSYVTIMSEGNTLYTGSVQNGGFRFSGYVNGAREGLYIFQTKYGKDMYPLFIEPGIIRIQDSSIIETNSIMTRFLISGTPYNDLFSRFNKELSLAYPNNFSGYDEDYQAFDKRKRKYIQQYIQTHKSSLLTLELFRRYFLSANINVQDKLMIFHSIDQTIRDTYGGREMANKLQQLVNTSVGKTAPLFTLPDSLNKSVALQQFRGKYVLLDFWASWCGPCRKENPAIKKVYEAFRDSNFVIVSVSLDEDKEKWTKAIRQDQLNWVHVSDLKGWENKVARQYYIEAVPTNFLLDPGGIIIAKNLNGETLRTQLLQAMDARLTTNR